MKSIFSYLIFLVLLTGCGDAKLNKLSEKQSQIEEDIMNHLITQAENTSQCGEEMKTLIKSNELDIKNFSVQFRKLIPQKMPGLPDTDENYFKKQYLKILSPEFKEALTELSTTLKAIAADHNIISSLKTIHGETLIESGDRIAEILTALTESPYAGTLLLEGVKLYLACESFDPSPGIEASMNLISKVKNIIAGNLGYLLGNTTLLEDSKKIMTAVELIKKAEKIQAFLPAPTTTADLQFICDMPNLDAYQNHIKFLSSLLLKNPNDSKAPRPLRALLNMSLKLYTMNKETNKCLGTSFDSLKQEDLKNNLETIADYLVDEKVGLLSIINAMKPRT